MARGNHPGGSCNLRYRGCQAVSTRGPGPTVSRRTQGGPGGRKAVWVWVFLLCSWSFLTAPGPVRANPPEDQVKAAVIFNLLKFVDWPPGTFPAGESPLVVGVLERDPLAKALSQLQGKVVQGRPLVIQRSSQPEQLKHCHAVVLGEPGQARALLTNFRGLPILTVTDGLENMAALGAVMNLLQEEGKLRFQVNLEAAGHARLSINSQLLKLAKIVGRP